MKLLLLAVLVAPVATAATFSPTRFDDPPPDGCRVNDCSLREAVAAASAYPGADVVSLVAGEYLLDARANGAVTILVPDSLTLAGPNMNTTTIRSRGPGPMFDVTDSTFRVRGLTMRDANRGVAPGALSFGGAIHAVRSALHIDRSAFRDNKAAMGGAIMAETTSVNVAGAAFTGNAAEYNGGAVWIGGGALRLTVHRTIMEANSAMDGGAIMAWDYNQVHVGGGSVLRNNSASRWGGAAHFGGEFLAEDDTTVADNVADYGGAFSAFGTNASLRGAATPNGDGLLRVRGNSATFGGGLYVFGHGTTIEHVQLLENASVTSGGGAYLLGLALMIRDSHIAANVSGFGGGVHTNDADVTFERVSIQDNRATGSGGGLALGYGTHALRSVDVYGNSAGTGAAIHSYGTLSLAHVTVWNNGPVGARQALSLWPTSTTSYQNSLLLGRCTGGGVPVAQGKNQRSNEFVSPCPGSVAGSTHLSRGAFGGRFEISGTTNPASSLINSGSTSHCLATDIRNHLRDPRCDIGAFEYRSP